MVSDRALGALLIAVSVIVIVVYAYLVFFAGQAIALWTLRATGFIAVAGVFGLLAWIGYTLATTPPPKPIEEIEKELEEELKKLEKELQESKSEASTAKPSEEKAKGESSSESKS